MSISSWIIITPFAIQFYVSTRRWFAFILGFLRQRLRPGTLFNQKTPQNKNIILSCLLWSHAFLMSNIYNWMIHILLACIKTIPPPFLVNKSFGLPWQCTNSWMIHMYFKGKTEKYIRSIVVYKKIFLIFSILKKLVLWLLKIFFLRKMESSLFNKIDQAV